MNIIDVPATKRVELTLEEAQLLVRLAVRDLCSTELRAVEVRQENPWVYELENEVLGA